MSEMKSLLVLERGEIEEIVFHQLVPKTGVQLYHDDYAAIKESWQGVLSKNPKAFPGLTIRLAGRHYLGDKLVLEVIGSDYKDSSVLSWLGVAMVPVTSDGYIALQGPVEAIAATIGQGIRVPGCTPQNTEVLECVVDEIYEEFGIAINKNYLTVLGLIEARPPIAKLHHGLVVKVRVPFYKKEFKARAQKAKDKWEGELKFLKIGQSGIVRLSRLGGYKAFNKQSLLILAMIAESEGGLIMLSSGQKSSDSGKSRAVNMMGWGFGLCPSSFTFFLKKRHF